MVEIKGSSIAVQKLLSNQLRSKRYYVKFSDIIKVEASSQIPDSPEQSDSTDTDSNPSSESLETPKFINDSDCESTTMEISVDTILKEAAEVYPDDMNSSSESLQIDPLFAESDNQASDDNTNQAASDEDVGEAKAEQANNDDTSDADTHEASGEDTNEEDNVTPEQHTRPVRQKNPPQHLKDFQTSFSD